MIAVPTRKTVAIESSEPLDLGARLFVALEAAFPVSFCPVGEGEAGPDALIAIAGATPSEPATGSSRPAVPTLVLSEPGRAERSPGRFVLGDGEFVDRRLRGLEARDPLDGEPLPSPGSGVEVLASAGGVPVWTHSRGAGPLHRVSSSLPELGPEQALRDLFDDHALALIAIVHLLRSLDREVPAPAPPLRATFLFDDPNLRWPTYGFIDYRRLLEHADRHGYHASMATIPLDGRFQHRATVDLFRRRPDRLSLTLHGNNHLSRELMRPANDAEALGLAAQALRRLERFEARNQLGVDRVMVPPHGMCSAAGAGALGALGFDALCAIHPFPWREQPPASAPLAGWERAEFAAGCAVIPRVHIDTGYAEMAIRAFLDQPLVIYGHHDDLAVGLDRLAEIAAYLGRLGAVRWGSLGTIAATNYSTRQSGATMVVAPYSHRMQVVLPQSADTVQVEAPRALEDRFAGWSAAESEPLPFGTPLPGVSGELEIRLVPVSRVDPGSVPPPAPSVWPIVRRAATETRDRLAPLLTSGSG